MKKFLNFLVLIFISFCSHAQNHLIGIKGGVSWSNIHSKQISTDAFRAGFTAGLTYENRIKQNIFFGAELIYHQRGFKDEIYFTDMFGNFYAENEFKFNYNYLAIPLKGGFIIGNKVSGYANIGLIPSFLLKAKLKFPYDIIDSNFDLTEATQVIDFAGLAELGGNWQFSESLAISVSFAYQHSFTTFANPDYFISADASHYDLLLSGGIKYILD